MKTKKLISALLAICLMFTLLPAFGLNASAIETETLYFCSFESEEEMEGWLFFDNDGDGKNWQRYGDGESKTTGATDGVGALLSFDYENFVGALTPDNWAYTPAIKIPAVGASWLSYDVFAQDPEYCAEHYTVYAYVEGKGVTELFTETLKEGEDRDTPAHRNIALDDFAGQTIQIVFRHHDVTDLFAIGIDSVKVEHIVPRNIDAVAVNVDEPTLNAAITGWSEVPVDYSGYQIANVVWETDDTEFKVNKEYTVVVTLEAEEDYVFPAGIQPYINERAATIITQSEQEMKISCTFSKLLLNIDEVSVFVQDPTVGKSISNIGETKEENPNYTVTNVQWEPNDTEFKADTAYTVLVTLEAKENYVFTESTVPYINENPATIVSQSAQEMKISYSYSKLLPLMPSMYFVDVKTTDWFYGDVEYAYYYRLMNGVGNNKFDPYGACTRGMIVTILYRMEGSPAHSGKNPFTDVKSDQWYTDAVIWAAENGIVDGMGNGKFEPNTNVTREQLATILCRFAKTKGLYKDEDCTMLIGFADQGKVASWAADSMSWAVGVGLVGGSNEKDGLYLMPQGNAQRCQVAAIFQRFCTNFAYFG